MSNESDLILLCSPEQNEEAQSAPADAAIDESAKESPEKMDASIDNSAQDISFVDNCFSVLDNEDSISDEDEQEKPENEFEGIVDPKMYETHMPELVQEEGYLIVEEQIVVAKLEEEFKQDVEWKVEIEEIVDEASNDFERIVQEKNEQEFDFDAILDGRNTYQMEESASDLSPLSKRFQELFGDVTLDNEYNDAEGILEDKTFLNESNGELLSIISGEKQEGDMVAIFQKFLSDPTLKSILLNHLFEFCQILGDDDRDKVAKKFGDFVAIDESNTSYRVRVEFLEQLIPIVSLFDANKVNRHFSGFALAFSADRIAIVRHYGNILLAEVVGILMRNEWTEYFENTNTSEVDTLSLPLTVRLIHEIRQGFWNNRSWKHRQSFARVMSLLLQKELLTNDQFCFLFFDDLMRISEDDVNNVRQYFCILAQRARSSDFFKDTSLDISRRITNRLKQMIGNDEDMEIRFQAETALALVDPSCTELRS